MIQAMKSKQILKIKNLISIKINYLICLKKLKRQQKNYNLNLNDICIIKIYYKIRKIIKVYN